MKIKVTKRDGFVHVQVLINSCWQTVVHSEAEEKVLNRVVEIDINPTMGDSYETHTKG